MTGHRLVNLALIFSLFLFIPNTLTAEEEINAPASFIDLDGDGLNDNAPDADGDGIFDLAESDLVPAPAEAAPSDAGLVSFDVTGTDFATDFTPNSGKFLKLNQGCRVISNNRGGFGSGDQFGPGNGIGIGAVSSGGCAGGVCH